jgi:hypothetical protein
LLAEKATGGMAFLFYHKIICKVKLNSYAQIKSALIRCIRVIRVPFLRAKKRVNKKGIASWEQQQIPFFQNLA